MCRQQLSSYDPWLQVRNCTIVLTLDEMSHWADVLLGWEQQNPMYRTLVALFGVIKVRKLSHLSMNR